MWRPTVTSTPSELQGVELVVPAFSSPEDTAFPFPPKNWKLILNFNIIIIIIIKGIPHKYAAPINFSKMVRLL